MVAPSNIFYNRANCRGRLRLEAEAITSIVNADTYYKIAGTFLDGESRLFEVSENKLTWHGPDNAVFLFNGVSDAQVDKACTITYGLFRNGALLEDATGGTAESPHTFPASARISTLAITDIVKLQKNDELEVYAKSSAINTNLDVKTLVLTFWGGCV